jgi:hypothetical protein
MPAQPQNYPMQISNIINKIYLELRKIMARYCEENSIFATTETELDESYCGANGVKGKRYRGTKDKIFMF